MKKSRQSWHKGMRGSVTKSPADASTYSLWETTDSCVILQDEPVCSALFSPVVSLSLPSSSHYYTQPPHSNITMRFPRVNVPPTRVLSQKSVGTAGRLWHKYTRYNLQTLMECFFWGGGGKPANVCGGLGRSKGGDLGHMQQITRLGFKPECFHNMEFRHTHLGGITLLKPS